MKLKHFGWLVAGSMLVGCSGPSAYQQAMYDSNDHIQTSGDSYYYQDRVGSTLSFSFRSFTGSETLLSYPVAQDLRVEVDYEVLQGRFKVVWIQGDELVELTMGEHLLVVSSDGARLKVVGDHAQGSVSIEVAQPE